MRLSDEAVDIDKSHRKRRVMGAERIQHTLFTSNGRRGRKPQLRRLPPQVRDMTNFTQTYCTLQVRAGRIN